MKPAGIRRLVGSALIVFASFAGFALVAIALLAGTALFALRARPGDWPVRAAFGPIGIDLSVPALVRVATHPLGIRLLSGRSIATRFGRVHTIAGPTPTSLVVRCAPCLIDSKTLAAEPIRLARVELSIEHGEPNELHGELRVDRVHATWHARLAASSADLDLKIADTPAADLVALFGHAVPEAARARIEGRAGATLRIALPSYRYTIEPRLEGLSVEGLGTEALLAATPTPACGRASRATRSATPFGAWLPRAVVAAEDQRFYEHAGYDIAEMAAAWSGESTPPQPRRGASTLSQQLAKLLYTGDARTAARKVRELLYAAELDRTLGKARVLQLYLAVAPWGDGQCGAEAAALHYFGTHAAALDASQAVWLASLLRNPEAELERSTVGLDTARLESIADGPRPVSRPRREALQQDLREWSPPPVLQVRRAPPVGIDALVIAR